MKKFKNNTRQSNKVVVFLLLFLSLSKQAKVFTEKYRRFFFLVFKFKFGFDLDGGHEGRMRVIPYTVVPKASFTNLPVNCVKRKHKEEKYFDIKYLYFVIQFSTVEMENC
jgi:hypothetical protein